ncbi:uncharacterized protein si:ch211-151h10.2 [Anabas testudineus]|uniref:uncharacterized protein si:ch211-151h10.2 n=1 Tax=Anabas testudineus TaxID=64144 RepID=UPI000E453CCD|nr:uncharacterized protein si:ch211-151h10.2 [Anabas testudineus]
MPQLTVAYLKGQGGTGQGKREGWDCACKWMEEVKEDKEGEPADRSQEPQRSNQTADDVRPQQTTWPQFLKTLRPWKSWYSFAPVSVLWSICHVDVLLHPSLFAEDVCGRLLLVCLLWVVVGGCVHALKCCLRPGQNQAEPPQRIQQEVVAENRNNLYLWGSRSGGPGHLVPLALALADGLLLCVLQEPLPDPSAPHIQTLLSRLESVSNTLEKADAGSEMTQKGVDQDSILTDKVTLIHTYLQQRIRSLRTLIQVQKDFEASVKDILRGLDGLWAQLEELHTGVTLTKEGNQGHRDLALVLTDAETLFRVLGHYKNKLQSCQDNLRDSTQLLQDLIWSHTHISNSVSSSGESVWPELLLQSNIEQFDNVQESFLSLEQQTCTFRAHLEGLGNQEGQTGPRAYSNRSHSCSVSPQTASQLHESTSVVPPVPCNSTSTSTCSSSVDADTDTEAETPLSLCERSALQFSSTIGRLRKSGRRK